MAVRAVMVAIVAGAVITPVVAESQASKTDELLTKTSDYVTQFVNQFTNVVAEETLVQETTVPRRKRTMRSDFLLVRYPGDSQWQSFRDVAEVDGKPVRDKEERLTRLFLEPASSAIRRARELQEAGARFNLLDIGTLNNPLMVLAFLQDIYRERFRFTVAGLDKKLGPTVRQVQFQEFKVPTLIKGNGNQDIPSRGLVWIEEDTGRVVQTELRIGGRTSPISVITFYKFDDQLGINVPVEMRDWYPDGTGELRGVASYGRFRRFQVQTSEEVKE
jgi:hypothetical protein